MRHYTHGQIKESEILLTSEEAFLGVDEMVRGLVYLNLTLPRLGHVPYPGVAGYHVELKKMGKTKQILTFEAPCVYATLVSALAPLSLMKSFVADCLLLTANISASRRVLYCMLLVVST